MQLVKELFAVCSVLILSASLGSSNVAAANLNAADNLSRLWIVSCSTKHCKDALTFAYDKKCNGERQCRAIVKEYYPECEKCVDELLEDENLEVQNNLNIKSFYCDPDDISQVLGCQFYCRVIYYPLGECVRQASTNAPVCQCSKPLPPAFGTAQKTLATNYDIMSPLVVLPSGLLSYQLPNETVNIWDIEKDLLLSEVKIDEIGLVSSHVVIGNDLIAFGSYEGVISTVVLETISLQKSWTAHTEIIFSLVVLPQSGRLASSSGDDTVKIWNVANGFEVKSFTLNGVRVMAALQNGKLACANLKKEILILDPETGMSVKTIETNEDFIRMLLVLPDGKLASASNTIKIWNPDNDYSLVSSLSGHSKIINQMAVLSNSAGHLVSCSEDKTVKIWNLAGNTLVKTIEVENKDEVVTLAPLIDGNLASGSVKGSVTIWNTKF